MDGHARTWFTPKQRAELWERWKSGQCVADIARALERRNKSGVYRILAVNGGIAPAPRLRAPVALRFKEREEFSRGIAAGWSIRRIAHRPYKLHVALGYAHSIGSTLLGDRMAIILSPPPLCFTLEAAN